MARRRRRKDHDYTKKKTSWRVLAIRDNLLSILFFIFAIAVILYALKH